jgi:hypothetical protein
MASAMVGMIEMASSMAISMLWTWGKSQTFADGLTWSQGWNSTQPQWGFNQPRVDKVIYSQANYWVWGPSLYGLYGLHPRSQHSEAWSKIIGTWQYKSNIQGAAP